MAVGLGKVIGRLVAVVMAAVDQQFSADARRRRVGDSRVAPDMTDAGSGQCQRQVVVNAQETVVDGHPRQLQAVAVVVVKKHIDEAVTVDVFRLGLVLAHHVDAGRLIFYHGVVIKPVAGRRAGQSGVKIDTGFQINTAQANAPALITQVGRATAARQHVIAHDHVVGGKPQRRAGAMVGVAVSVIATGAGADKISLDQIAVAAAPQVERGVVRVADNITADDIMPGVGRLVKSDRDVAAVFDHVVIEQIVMGVLGESDQVFSGFVGGQKTRGLILRPADDGAVTDDVVAGLVILAVGLAVVPISAEHHAVERVAVHKEVFYDVVRAAAEVDKGVADLLAEFDPQPLCVGRVAGRPAGDMNMMTPAEGDRALIDLVAVRGGEYRIAAAVGGPVADRPTGFAAARRADLAGVVARSKHHGIAGQGAGVGVVQTTGLSGATGALVDLAAVTGRQTAAVAAGRDLEFSGGSGEREKKQCECRGAAADPKYRHVCPQSKRSALAAEHCPHPVAEFGSAH